jgi:hypothetical protein
VHVIDDDQLTLDIARQLDIDHQYRIRLPRGAEERIMAVRRCGRRAARQLGWRVRTFLSDHDEWMGLSSWSPHRTNMTA